MVSDKSIEHLDNSAVRLTVTVDKDTVKKEYDDIVKEYAKQAQVKGFRKGKVPTSVMEMKFGESLKAETVQRLLENSLREAIDQVDEKVKPLPYAQPSLESEIETFDPEQDFTYTVKYDVYPNIELGPYTDLEVTEPQVEVSDEDLDRELKAIQEQNAVVMDKDDDASVEQDDIVTMDYHEVDSEGNAVHGTAREDFTFTVGSGYNYYKIDDDVIGMKKGEEKTVDKEYGDDVDSDELKNTQKRIFLRVKTIKQRDLPEIDDELAQDVSEEYETLDDLKKDIKSRLDDTAQNHMRQQKIESLLNQIVEGSTLQTPETMVQAEMSQAWQNFVQRVGGNEQQIDQLLQAQGRSRQDLLEEWRPSAEQSLRQRLVMGKLIEEEGIEVSGEEVDEYLKDQAEKNKMEFEDLKKQYEDNDLLEYVKNQLRERKLFDSLLERNKVKKGDSVKFLDAVGRNE